MLVLKKLGFAYFIVLSLTQLITMVDRKLMLLEVLFLNQNNFVTTPFANVQNIIANFCNDEEVTSSKCKLHEIVVAQFDDKEFGRLVTRKEYNKRKMVVADI